MLRELAHYCGSTALALAMHTHVAAAAAWRWRHQKAPTDGLLKRVATERIQLLLVRRLRLAPGLRQGRQGRRRLPGLRVQGVRERRAGRQPVHDRRHRGGRPGWSGSAAIRRPDERARPSRSSRPGTRLACAGPARTTSSLDGVFVPDAAIGARRKPGVWHPLLHIVALVAMPLVYSVYAGIAQAARDLAVETLAKRREPAVIARAWAHRNRARRHAHRARQHGCLRRDRAALPGDHQHDLHPPCAGLPRCDPDRRPGARRRGRRRLFPRGSVSSGCSATCRARAFILCRRGRSASSRAAWRSVCRSTDKVPLAGPGRASVRERRSGTRATRGGTRTSRRM